MPAASSDDEDDNCYGADEGKREIPDHPATRELEQENSFDALAKAEMIKTNELRWQIPDVRILQLRPQPVSSPLRNVLKPSTKPEK